MEDNSIRRIMVCIDGSEGSEAAVRWAIALARASGAEIVAAHVMQLPYPLPVPASAGVPSGLGSEMATFEYRFRDVVEREFREDWCAPIREAGVHYHAIFRVGRPGPMLVEEADAQHVDLIVTGRRGLGSVNELLAGSVSHYLVHRAGHPVLVVPNG